MHVFAQERAERRLDGRRAAQTVSRADVGREQLAALLEHGGAQRAALRQRQPLPHALEERLVLAEQPLQRAVQIVEVRRPSAARAHVVPDFVRQPLDVVGEVARELDDRGAEAGRRP